MRLRRSLPSVPVVVLGVASGLGVGALAAGLGSVGAGCGTPSSTIDGGDLMGVFSRDGGAADGGIVAIGSASAATSASAKPAKDAGPPVERRVREPDPASCVAEAGQPLDVPRRTIGRPACRGGDVLEWRDPAGEPRYGCVFAPNDVEKRAPLPLVVFFHGETPGLDDPGSVAKQTSLRTHLGSAAISGSPGHEGLVLLVVQGRVLGKLGATYDTGYSGADNLDRITTDHFVDALADKKWIDASRVYTMGIGDGGRMAATYAMIRADRVAAFVAYGAPPPTVEWQCPGPPPPGMLLYRACDARVACDDVETWLHARESRGAETRALRLGEDAHEEPNCAVSGQCSKKRGEAAHDRWPKAREKDVLAFLAEHALARP
jgi:hypothetical protein